MSSVVETDRTYLVMQANILMDNGRAYLCDFGLSNIMVEFQVTSLITSTVAGACRWAAPELFPVGTVDEMQPTITKACDIYSFGSITLQVSPPSTLISRNNQVWDGGNIWTSTL